MIAQYQEIELQYASHHHMYVVFTRQQGTYERDSKHIELRQRTREFIKQLPRQ